jgi:hypothetical protein
MDGGGDDDAGAGAGDGRRARPRGFRQEAARVLPQRGVVAVFDRGGNSDMAAGGAT